MFILQWALAIFIVVATSGMAILLFILAARDLLGGAWAGLLGKYPWNDAGFLERFSLVFIGVIMTIITGLLMGLFIYCGFATAHMIVAT